MQNLRHCNWTRTHNQLACKQTLNQLAKVVQILTSSLLFKKFTNFTGHNSTNLRTMNEKFSGYYFYMNRNTQGYFQICISQCTFKVKQKFRGVFRTQLNIYVSFFAKIMNDFQPFWQKVPIVDVRLCLKYTSENSTIMIIRTKLMARQIV